MTIQYTWKILDLECEDNVEHSCPLITKAGYRLTGVEKGFKGVSYGIMFLNYNTITGIPFADLTENDILAIIQEKINQMGIAERKYFYQPIEQQINDKLFPASNVFVPLPWAVV